MHRSWKGSRAPNGGHAPVRVDHPGSAGKTHPYRRVNSSPPGPSDWDSAPGPSRPCDFTAPAEREAHLAPPWLDLAHPWRHFVVPWAHWASRWAHLAPPWSYLASPWRPLATHWRPSASFWRLVGLFVVFLGPFFGNLCRNSAPWSLKTWMGFPAQGREGVNPSPRDAGIEGFLERGCL